MADGAMTQQLEFIPSPQNARAFRDALGCFATGVTLVTINSSEGAMGFAANSFSAVSLDPPLVLWSPAKSSRRFSHFAGATHFAIHVLPQQQHGLLDRFMRDGPGFGGLTHQYNAENVPIIDTALSRFECRQHATHDGGDHVIIVGEVLRAMHQAGAPLIFSQGKYGGFSPLG